jgi:hypothetical protein
MAEWCPGKVDAYILHPQMTFGFLIFRAAVEQVDRKRNNQSAEVQHPTQDHPILRLTPTRWNLR